MSSTIWNICLATALVLTVACGGGQKAAGPGGESSSATVGEAAAPTPQPSVRTASVPDDPCAWIPVSDVEAVVGKLAGPPTRRDGCRYTLVMPEEVRARRQHAIDQIQRLRERFKDASIGEFGGSMGNYQRDPATYALTLSVDIRGSLAGELGVAAAGKHLESWLGTKDRPAAADKPTLDGWDAPGLAPYGFSGRIGHVQISVLGQAPDVPHDIAKALAERVRDRIPDLPFPTDNPYQVIRLGTEPKDPCTLLTRAEAEAVLGPLVVEPYRASSEWPPLVHAKGYGCTFFTAGHRVFSIVPSWQDGEQDFKMNQGLGALMSTVMPQDLVVIKGPWEKAHVSGSTGALLFLKGDRLLEVHYKASSTDMRGAVRLAAQAMQRMLS